MRFNWLRWALLAVAAVVLLVALFTGVTPGRVVLSGICGAAWYGLARRKIRSLDQDRLAGGKLGRRS